MESGRIENKILNLQENRKTNTMDERNPAVVASTYWHDAAILLINF